jgi:FKBP-type peptidyl-prolyl cis-trans isomerase FkpA
MKYVLIILSLALSFTACKKKTSNECTSTAGTTVAPAAEEDMVIKYLDSMQITNRVELENSGMYYVIDSTGNTKKPGQCSAITIKYKGYYRNGTVFDQTTGSNSTSFNLGGLIEGWKRALPLIGEAGKIRLFIPPSLGYGPAGYLDSRTGLYIIPPNAVLIFEISLLAVTN